MFLPGAGCPREEGGMPPLPKDAKTRKRRNKASTRSQLSVDHAVKAPLLPKDREWAKQTRAWWKAIWASPMAPEYLKADSHGLLALAVLVDDFWVSDKPSERTKIMAEIRLQRVCFGLTPIDRRRLEWEVGKVEGQRKRTPEPKTPKAGDPYGALRAV
jgi:hypothetical protein